MTKSFLDEDWTGLAKEQIYRQIVAELEEQQCKSDGQKYVCRSSLEMLSSIISEQIIAKQLDRSTGAYIYDAVRQRAVAYEWMGE